MKDSSFNLLSKSDFNLLLELINDSLEVKSETDFKTLLAQIHYLIPFEYAICAYSNTDKDGNILSYYAVNLSYPKEWNDLYFSKCIYKVDPIVKKNYEKYGLQFWADTYKYYPPPKKFIKLAADFRLNAGYTNGLRSLNGFEGSLFSFSGNKMERHERTEYILEKISPHLHHCLSRLRSTFDVNLPKKKLLSNREIEILKWLKLGKSSWDISNILGISERTVNFHVTNIMQKLDVVKRTQAVAVGIRLGLIALD